MSPSSVVLFVTGSASETHGRERRAEMNQESDQETTNQTTTTEQEQQSSTSDESTATTINCPPLVCRIVPPEFDPSSDRRDAAHALRVQRANVIVRQQPLAEERVEPAGSELCNGDEKRWQENLPAAFAHLKDKYVASYGKGFRHDNMYGEVDGNAYCAYLNAVKSGTFQGFESLEPYLGCSSPSLAADADSKDAQPQAQQQVAPQVAAAGNQLKLVNPLAALAFDLQGIDSHQALVWDWNRPKPAETSSARLTRARRVSTVPKRLPK